VLNCKRLNSHPKAQRFLRLLKNPNPDLLESDFSISDLLGTQNVIRLGKVRTVIRLGKVRTWQPLALLEYTWQFFFHLLSSLQHPALRRWKFYTRVRQLSLCSKLVPGSVEKLKLRVLLKCGEVCCWSVGKFVVEVCGSRCCATSKLLKLARKRSLDLQTTSKIKQVLARRRPSYHAAVHWQAHPNANAKRVEQPSCSARQQWSRQFTMLLARFGSWVRITWLFEPSAGTRQNGAARVAWRGSRSVSTHTLKKYACVTRER